MHRATDPVRWSAQGSRSPQFRDLAGARDEQLSGLNILLSVTIEGYNRDHQEAQHAPLDSFGHKISASWNLPATAGSRIRHPGAVPNRGVTRKYRSAPRNVALRRVRRSCRRLAARKVAPLVRAPSFADGASVENTGGRCEHTKESCCNCLNQPCGDRDAHIGGRRHVAAAAQRTE